MSRRAILLAACFAGFLLLAGSPAASAAPSCDNEWDSASNGDWTASAHWTAGHPPTATENACIIQNGTYTVTLNDPSTTVASLTLGAPNGQQSFVVQGAAMGARTLTATNGLFTQGGGSLVVNCPAAPITGCAGASVSVLGAIENTGRITVQTPVAVFGRASAAGVNLDNRGVISISDGASLSTDQTVTNGLGGRIEATGSGVLKTTGTFNQGAGTTSGAPVRFTAGGRLNFTGLGASAFQLENGTTDLTGSLAAGQSVRVLGTAGAADAALRSAAGFVNAGAIALDGDAASRPSLIGSLVNHGTLTVTAAQARYTSGTLTNQGLIAFANGAGLITDQSVQNLAGGRIAASGGAGLQTSGIFNQGAGTTSGAPVRFIAPGTLNFTGLGASSFQLENGITTVNGDIGGAQILRIFGIRGLAAPGLRTNTGLASNGSILVDGDVAARPRVEGDLVNGGNLDIRTSLSIRGTFGQARSGRTALVVDRAAFSSVRATGRASLAGRLLVATAAGAPNPPIRRILSTPTLTGSFDAAEYNGRLHALLYDDDGAFLSPTRVPSRGRLVGVGRVARTVSVDAGPGGFQRLGVARAAPVGADIDATGGTVSITTALGAEGAATGEVQSAAFRGGRFRITQPRDSQFATATLSEPLAGCSSSASTAARRKRRTRRLFGSGKGNFRTRGNFGAATVRGTTWEVGDFCDRTVYRAVRGSISVRDPFKRRTVTLTAGRSYTVRPSR